MKCEEIKPLLTLYLLGDLDAARSTEILTHLEGCGGCRAAVQEIEPTLDLLRDALAAPSAAPKRLSAKQKSKIVRKVNNPARKLVFWMTTEHPRLTRAAAIFTMAFTLWVISGRIMWSLNKDMYREFGQSRPAFSPLLGPIGAFTPMFKMGEVVGDSSCMIEMKSESPPPASALPAAKKEAKQVFEEVSRDVAAAPEEAAQVFSYDGAARSISSSDSKDSLKSRKRVEVSRGKVAEKEERLKATEAFQNSNTKSGKIQDFDQRISFATSEKKDELTRENLKDEMPMAGVAVVPQQTRPEQPNDGWLSGGSKRQDKDGAVNSDARDMKASGPVTESDVMSLAGAPAKSASAGQAGIVANAEVEEMVDINSIVKKPKPLFVGTPTNMKGVNLDPNREGLFSAERTDDNVRSVGREEEARSNVDSPGMADHYKKIKEQGGERDKSKSELALAGKGFSGNAFKFNVPGETQASRGSGVGGDMNMPAVPSEVVITKSPVIMNGIYGNRSKGGRGKALRAYGGGGAAVDNELQAGLEKATDEAYARAEAPADKLVKPAAQELKAAVEQKEPEEDKSGPRFKAYGVNPFVMSKDQPFSTFGIDCDTASYTLARNYMLKGYLPPAEAVRTEEFVNFFDYAYKAPERDTFKVYVECAPSKFGRGGLQMMKIGVKGRRLGREEQRRAVLTFLVDTSGSMEQPDRIGLVKKSLRLLVEKLNPQDLISLVKYDSHAKLVLEHVPAAEKQKILEAIDNLQCNGSTNLEEGMGKAYQIAARNFLSKGENRVLLMSDGVANLGEVAAKDILAKVEKYRKQGIFCSVFGLGIGTYNDEMLQELANKGDGTYKFLDSEAEARKVFVDDLAANLNTIAKNVKIQVEFNPDRISRYRQIGYERRQLKKEDFRNDKIDAGEVGSGQSVTALYEAEVRSQKSEYGMKRPEKDVIATVRVRYQRVDNGQIEEIERKVTADDMVAQFDQADARFRLAACAAQFAEILRGSPFAEGREFQDISRVLAPIALEMSLDGRVQEFNKLVNGANGLSRGK